MKEEKKAIDNNRIMRCLLDGGSYTTLQIADQVGLSEKTVRTKVSLINDWLEEENLGRIERKQGKGIWLVADENQKKCLNQLLLTDQGLDSGNVLLDLGDLHRVLQLIGRMLKAKIEQVLLQLVQLGLQLIGGHSAHFTCLHHHSPPFSVSAVSFVTTLHLTGSL